MMNRPLVVSWNTFGQVLSYPSSLQSTADIFKQRRSVILAHKLKITSDFNGNYSKIKQFMVFKLHTMIAWMMMTNSWAVLHPLCHQTLHELTFYSLLQGTFTQSRTWEKSPLNKIDMSPETCSKLLSKCLARLSICYSYLPFYSLWWCLSRRGLEFQISSFDDICAEGSDIMFSQLNKYVNTDHSVMSD